MFTRRNFVYFFSPKLYSPHTLPANHTSPKLQSTTPKHLGLDTPPYNRPHPKFHA